MPFQTIAGGLWSPERLRTNDVSPLLSLTIDAVGENAGFVVRAPKTGNITHVIYSLMTVAVTSGPLNFDARLETLDSDGTNSGTLLNSGTSNDSNGADSIADTDDNDQREVALTTSGGVAVTLGQQFAFILQAPGAGTFNVQLATLGGDPVNDDPYGISNGAKTNRGPVLAFRYSDGNVYAPLGSLPFETIASLAVGTGSTPDEVGNRFQYPFPVRINAVEVYMDPTAATSALMQVFAADETTVLYSVTIDCDLNFDQSDGTVLVPTSDLDFDANEVFFVTFTPQEATTMDFTYAQVEDTDYWDFDSGLSVYSVSRTNNTGGLATLNTRRYFISVRICAFDNGAAIFTGRRGAGAANLSR